jgi:anti-sigma-K factor RskA
MGITILLLLALNVFSVLQVRTLKRQQTQLMGQLQSGQLALAMLSYSKTQTYPINVERARGSLLLDKEYNNAVLILRGLPSIPNTQTYQIWLISPNEDRVSAGVFRPQIDQPFISQTVYATQDLTNFVGIDMTIEPAGGSAHPTGTQIFRVDF